MTNAQINNDTICAISTPPGEAGIGIVRLSGRRSLSIADKIFLPKNGKKPSQMSGYTVHYGHVVAKGKGQRAKGKNLRFEIIDEVLLTIMRSPKSYTKEDVIEISAHGGITVLRKILDIVLEKGARIAEPGEFTKRAFLNGRIDLAQAEAVIDIINAKTEDSLKAARRQLEGELSGAIRDIRKNILEVLANVEASLDFPDEQLRLDKNTLIKTKLKQGISGLEALLSDYKNGKILRDGITTVICGKPNVGKSTLMNRFLKQKRVIVTSTPGTTRDAIEEIINVNGIPIKIVDTAGIIPNGEDEPSRQGVLKSRKYMESADLILLVLDSSDELSKEDLDIIDTVNNKKVVFIINKTDLPERLQIDEIKSHLHNKKVIRISAKKDKTLDVLYNAITDIIWAGGIASSHHSLLTNIRHANLIKEALRLLEYAKTNYDTKGAELIAQKIKEAMDKLGIITGEDLSEDLLNEIFSRFCVGK